MSDSSPDLKLAAEAEVKAKTPSKPPESPRTGRLHDDIDKLPDVHSAVTSDIYKKLEAIQEAFFAIDQSNRFEKIDTTDWTNEDVLKAIEDKPFHSKLLYEMLRRVRKGQITPETAAKYYSNSKKHKRNLVDNIVTRIDAGAIKFETLPDGSLESLQLGVFLEALFDTVLITPEDVQEYNASFELDIFMKQWIKDMDLPVAKAVPPGFQPPRPTTPVVPGTVAIPAPPIVPGTFKVPPPPASSVRVPAPANQLLRKQTLLAITVPPPAAGSAPGAPGPRAVLQGVATPAPPRPNSAPASVAPPSVVPRPVALAKVALKPGSVVPPSISTVNAYPPPVPEGPMSQSVPTVREGAGRTSPKDPIASRATLADEEATQRALSRDPTHSAIHIMGAPMPTSEVTPVQTLPPPVPVGAMGSPDDPNSSNPEIIVFPGGLGSKKPSHLPPPTPFSNATPEKLDENAYQSMHSVTVMGDSSDPGTTINIPLLSPDGEFTIGTNPRNDIVLQNPPGGSDIIAEFHAVIKISGDKISVKGVKGPVRVAPKSDRRGLVMHQYVQVDDGEPIFVGRMVNGKPDQYVQIDVKLDQVFLNDEVKDQLSERCKNLLRTAGEKIHEEILEGAEDKPNYISSKSEEAKSLIKKASEIFQGLIIRFPDKIKDADFNNWRNIALSDAQMLLSKRLSSLIVNYGQEMLKSAKQAVTAAIANGTEIAEITLETDPPRFFADFFLFAKSHGIRLDRNEFIYELDNAKSEPRRYLAEKKQVEADIKEADRRRAEMEDELKNRPERDHETALKHFQEVYAGVHYRDSGEGSEMLSLETKFAHVGPVIIVRDSSNRIIAGGLRPLLIDHQTIGTHEINTIELPKDRDPKRGAKPFMASIEYDEKLGQYRMTWIDGEIKLSNNQGGAGMPRSPVFALENSKPVFVGKYTVRIEQNHAFTASSISSEHANPLIEELTEIIFNDTITTLDQTAKAYDELLTLASTGHVDIVALRVHLAMKMKKFWARLQGWDSDIDIQPDPDAAPVTPGRDRPSVLADAQALGTLHLLLKDDSGFIPQIEGLNQAAIEAAAKYRLITYAELDKKSKEPGPLFPKIYGLFSMGKASMAKQAKQKEDAKVRANIGVVEIARFLDMGIINQEFVDNGADVSEEYGKQINEIYQIRKLVDEIRNGSKDLENFERAMELCGNKTMEEVFGPEEIAAFNVNIEVNIKPKDPAIKYLKKLCIFLGRNQVRLLGNVDNKQSIATIEKLLAIKAITYDEIVVPPYYLGGEVKSAIEDAKMFAQMKEEAEQQEGNIRSKKLEAFQKQADAKNLYRQGLIEKFSKVVDAVTQAQQEIRLDILLEVADIILDPQVEDEMDGDGISMQVLRYTVGAPPSNPKAGDRANVIMSEQKRVGWHTVKDDFKTVAVKTARVAAEKIMKAHPDSAYQLDVLQEAIQKGIIDPKDVGYTPEQLEQKVKQTSHEQKIKALRLKYKPFFDENQNLRIDNLEYLDQIKLDEISDPDEAAVLLELIESISYSRMENILENIEKKHDVSYMKIVGNELMEKGYRAQLYFSPEKLALLQ